MKVEKHTVLTKSSHGAKMVTVVEGTAARLGRSRATRQTTSLNPTPTKAVLLCALRLAFLYAGNQNG
jgi:hypothetical protein